MYTSPASAEETMVVEKFERCRAQQHGVYDHMGSLTRLKHLDLGCEDRNPYGNKCANGYEVDGIR